METSPTIRDILLSAPRLANDQPSFSVICIVASLPQLEQLIFILNLSTVIFVLNEISQYEPLCHLLNKLFVFDKRIL